jgi:hypothetical protein
MTAAAICIAPAPPIAHKRLLLFDCNVGAKTFAPTQLVRRLSEKTLAPCDVSVSLKMRAQEREYYMRGVGANAASASPQ